jgi:hypothetical protein
MNQPQHQMSDCSFTRSTLNQKNDTVKNFVCRKVTIHLRERSAYIPTLVQRFMIKKARERDWLKFPPWRQVP